MRTIYPVIMCGGVGSRLWPLSRKVNPKQFHNLVSDKSMLRETYLRTSVAKNLEIAEPSFVCAVDYEAKILDQCAMDNVAPHRLILEPCARNTAAVAAAIALDINDFDPDACVLLMPADHHISNPQAFWSAIEAGIGAEEQGQLVTFGIEPDRPETGYGYILRGEALNDTTHKVAAFVEKPDAGTAQAYLESGEYFWNAGIFLFKPSIMIKAFERYAPDILENCSRAVSQGKRDGANLFLDPASFSACRKDSIDYAIMEQADNVAIVAAQDMGWSDIGAWQAITDMALEKSDGKVVQIGDVIAQDCARTYLRSEGPFIAAIGVSDIIIVATHDAVLVTRADQSQDVKKIVEALGAQGRPELL